MHTTLPLATSTIPPAPRPLPSASISRTAIHLRPARIYDLPQCWAIHSYWIIHHAANMYYVPMTFGNFKTLFDNNLNFNLPFVVAVHCPTETGAIDTAVVGGRRDDGSDEIDATVTSTTETIKNPLHRVWPIASPRTPREILDGHDEPQAPHQAGVLANREHHDDEVDGELILGFAHLLPNFPEETGHAIFLCGQSTYIHPSLHISGIGTRLSVLMCNLAKAPERYTQYPPPGTLSSSASFSSPKHPELDPSSYHAFRNRNLRPIKAILRRTVVDEVGVGKGKSRFFKKLGFTEVGYVEKAGIKWGRVYGMRYWYLDLEEWDEVRSCLKSEVENARTKAAERKKGARL